MSGPEIDLSGLIASMENAIESQFPGWLISREHSGRWTAVRPQWGKLHADNAPELLQRLWKHADGDGAR